MYKALGESNQEDSVMEAIVNSRNGSVLGKRAILKMYFFPGQKTTSDHVPIPGAPHVCKVRRFPCTSYLSPYIPVQAELSIKSEFVIFHVLIQNTASFDSYIYHFHPAAGSLVKKILQGGSRRFSVYNVLVGS